ncbi:hypothetical protein FOZ60_007286 [Perkinsus olseni]|uniref:Uncharacterized protein n=1 Tax=Perkinsus olseni TaxID=32597 RepID=A0A7J6NMD0_PEROL|nr:hypothetical protein FOZ60_007286 [Perkinsus olseni]
MTIFDNDKFTANNENQANGAELNAECRKEGEEYLPMAVLQLRRVGLNGERSSAGCLKDIYVKTPILDPALSATVMLTAMITGSPLRQSMEKVLRATSGLCLGQCWVCSPTIWVYKEGRQLASAKVPRADRVSHLGSTEHKQAINWALWFARDLYAIWQATAEGMRLGMDLKYSDLDTEYWKQSWNNDNWVLAEGQLHPHTGYLACILCNKAPSSRLKISEHPSGGYRSAKQYQHFYYFQGEMQSYTGSRFTSSVYCEGRPAALSNNKCVQNYQWVNYWRSLYNARFCLTQTAFTHLRPEVERSLRDVATRLGYRLEQDLRSITISPPDIPPRESVNLSMIYHRDFSEDSENPTVSAEYLGTTDDDDYESASESVAGSGTVSSARVPEFLNLSQPLASLTNPRVSSSSSSTRRVSAAESTEARPGLSPEDARSRLRQLQEEISELERSMERIERSRSRTPQ